MITTTSGDQVTITQPKEELESIKKSNSELTDKLTKSEDSRIFLLRANSELKLDITSSKRSVQNEIHDLKVQLDEEKKKIGAWAPLVQLSSIKLEHMLPMCTTHAETYTSSTSP